MAKCARCGFPHAIPEYCSNCGSSNPLPDRKLVRLALTVFGIIILAAMAWIPVSLYLERIAVHRNYPPTPPLPSPSPAN